LGGENFLRSSSGRQNGSGSAHPNEEALLHVSSFGGAPSAPVLEPHMEPVQELHQMWSKFFFTSIDT
jgi:hypothetical protein